MNAKKFLLFFIVSVFIALFALAPQREALGAAGESPDLAIRVEYAQADSVPWAVVWLDIRAEYHAYAHTPGATGKPTVLNIGGTAGKKAFPVAYPAGELQKDIYSPTETVRVYAGSVPLFVNLSRAEVGQTLKGTLDVLLCSARHCMPVRRQVELRLPAAPLAALEAQPFAPFWKQAVKGEAAAPTPLAQAAPQAETPPVSDIRLADAGEWTFVPRYVQEELEVESLGKALLLGLLAGLLLNVMPCVLPVLTLKASAMLVVGAGNREERLRSFREHNLLFAAGVMTQFFVLAMILGTAGLIWGQLFQSTALVTAMLIVVFLLGLSMLGLFTLPVIDLKADSSASPRLNAYLTGIMATLLATPCSGPLLGGVLGWAFTQPLAVLVVVFLAVGVGMSTPYLVFALRPELAAFLPRPGAWMGLLERGVGFFLLATSLYLLSILPQDRHLPLLAALLAVAVGGWIWGHFGGYDAPPWRRKALGLGLVALTLGVVFLASRPPMPLATWEPFSPASFREHLGKEPMLLEFTADWCPNCKFLEQTVLTQTRLRQWQKKYGLRLVRVDLTREDAPGQELLQALGSSSIPLTAIFPRGLSASAPVVLRDIYAPDVMEQALQKAFPRTR